MQQVLIRIPLDAPWFFGIPGFGFGIVLALWVLAGVWWFRSNRQQLSGNVLRIATFAVIWIVVAGVIVALPQLLHISTDSALADAKTRVKNLSPGSKEYAQAFIDRDKHWRKRRLFTEAIQAYKQESADNPEAKLRLAWILATAPDADVRDGKEATQLANEAISNTRASAAALDTLAAAYAESGKYSEAIATATRAAKATKRSATVDPGEAGDIVGIRQRLQDYQSHRPYKDINVGRSVPLYGYGFMMFVGFVAAGWTAIRRGRLVGIEKDVIWDVCLWVLVGGVGGARLFYIVQYRESVFKGAQSPGDYLVALFNLREGGLVLYGGITLALAAFVLFCWRRKLSPLLMTDIIMPSFFIGLAFGRLGCFMNGCCYGDRCDLPWAIPFPLGSVPDMVLVDRGFLDKAQAVTIALHPSQVYSSLNALLLAFLMHCFFFVRRRDGSVLALALLTYPVTRFLIEFLRGDEMGKLNTPLTISQWVQPRNGCRRGGLCVLAFRAAQGC